METEKRLIVCIRCPRGCEISAKVEKGEVSEIKGNVCKLGKEYVKDEILNPRRILTTTVKVKNGLRPLAAVWTPDPIPADRITEIADKIRRITLEAPVKRGDKVLTGIDGIYVEASDDNPARS